MAVAVRGLAGAGANIMIDGDGDVTTAGKITTTADLRIISRDGDAPRPLALLRMSFDAAASVEPTGIALNAVKLTGITELVANAMVMKGEKERTLNFRKEPMRAGGEATHA